MKLFTAISKALGMTVSDRIDRAVERTANFASEAQKFEMRERLYNEALELIDHEREWNLYAHFKQKAYDAHIDYRYHDRKYRHSLVEARKAINEGLNAPQAVPAATRQTALDEAVLS